MTKRSSYGWLELILGVLLVVLGVFTAYQPTGTLLGFILVFGIVAIITGIADIVFFFRLRSHGGPTSWIRLVTGILGIIAGILLLVYPDAGAWAFSILFPVWFIVHCVNRLVNLDFVRATAGKGMYWFTLILNVLGIILGILLLFQPAVSLLSLSFLISFYLIFVGISSIALGISAIGEAHKKE